MNENKLMEELKKVTVKEEQVKRLVEAESLEAFRQILAECGAEIGEEEAKGLCRGFEGAEGRRAFAGQSGSGIRRNRTGSSSHRSRSSIFIRLLQRNAQKMLIPEKDGALRAEGRKTRRTIGQHR